MKGEKSKHTKKSDFSGVDVTPLGSLGLLAFGYEGLRKWREVRGNKLNYEKIRKSSQSHS